MTDDDSRLLLIAKKVSVHLVVWETKPDKMAAAVPKQTENAKTKFV